MLGKQEGVGAVRPIMLFNPALNIQLGTRYLRGQLDSWNGDWYQTLAAYNAGPSRVKQWLTWTKFDEPEEFVEDYPAWNETRASTFRPFSETPMSIASCTQRPIRLQLR